MLNFLHDLFIRPTDRIAHQYIRYTLVGGSAFVIDFGLLYLLVEFFGIQYLLAATVSFLVGSAYNYALSVRFIFPTRVFENRQLEFVIFVGIGVSGLVLNAGVIYVCTAFAGLHYLLSKAIAGVGVFSWNFIARRFMLFSR